MLLVLTGLAGSTTAASAASSSAPSAMAPTWKTYAFASPGPRRTTLKVRLVRRASGTPVAKAVVRFSGTRNDGTRHRARVSTNARGVARWALPVPSRRFRYLEAKYYAPGDKRTYLQLGFCRGRSGWQECGAG